MKIYGDKTAPGYIPEKSEPQSRISKTPKSDSDKITQVALTGDDLELTGKKVPVTNSMLETNIGITSTMEFDIGEVPMMKQKLTFIIESILSRPTEALAAQANLNSESVARLIV